MIKEIFYELYNEHLKKWFIKYFKPLLVILMYILYQSNFLIGIINSFGLDLSNIPRNLRIIILILNDLAYIISLLLLFKTDIKNGIKDFKENINKRLTLSINCWIVGCLIMTISSIIISAILNKDVSTNEEIVRQSIKLAPFYMLFTCSVVAPVFEEMVFRKALHSLIKPKWLFIMLSGVSFGLLHVLGSYTSILDFLYVIPYGAMGSALAFLLTKTNNIFLPIAIHMLHNTILVLIQIIGG